MKFHKERYKAFIRPEYYDRTKPISYEEWQTMQINSYERLCVHPLMTNDCLSKMTQDVLKNCRHDRSRIPATYDDMLANVLTPLLIERLNRRWYRSKRLGHFLGGKVGYWSCLGRSKTRLRFWIAVKKLLNPFIG